LELFTAPSNKFQGERKDFVSVILKNCFTKKLWTYVDIQGILRNYVKADRQRIITALEFFSEKGWIELHSSQAIEVYEIITRDFNIEKVCKNIYNLFGNKEQHEIQRIYNMVDFFERSSCISKRLALYFGENIEKLHCEHCSLCKNGKAVIQYTTQLKPLSSFNYNELIKEFNELIGEHYSVLNVTKFFCGISSPLLTKFRSKNLPHFGIFEKYPFLAVKNWVSDFVADHGECSRIN